MEIDLCGHKVLIDDEDFELVSKHSWSLDKDKYLRTSQRLSNNRFVGTSMHRLIMGCTNNDGKFVDHRNGNVHDNRRCNLRICTASENMRNSKRPKNNKSGVKGVYWNKKAQKWRAYIMVDCKEIHLGYFSDIDDAKKVHDEAAIKYHGEFARLN